MGNPLAQVQDALRRLFTWDPGAVPETAITPVPKPAILDRQTLERRREGLVHLLEKPSQTRISKGESDGTGYLGLDREVWEQVGGVPGLLYGLGDALQQTHELFVKHDVYRYALMGLVVLAGLNRGKPEGTQKKIEKTFYAVGEGAHGMISDCRLSLWDQIFGSKGTVSAASDNIFSGPKKQVKAWLLDRNIEIEGKEYEVKVSPEGDIVVNGRTWHLKDADSSRNANISVKAVRYDPDEGLHFQIKGEKYLISKEVSKDLDLAQTAYLLERLATAESDPTTDQMRAAGVELARGSKTGRG